MGALAKRLTEPAFGSILSTSVYFSFGLAWSVVGQTFLTIIGRMETEFSTRLEFPSRGEQFNWDWHFGHPWFSMIIGFCVGIVWHLLEKPDPTIHRQIVESQVMLAQGKSPIYPLAGMKRHVIMLCGLLVLASLMTYFLHVSAAVFSFIVVAAINGLNYAARRRIYVDTCARLNAMTFDPPENDRITNWHQRNRRIAVTGLLSTVVVVVIVSIGTGVLSRSLWNEFLDAENERAARLDDWAAASGVHGTQAIR